MTHVDTLVLDGSEVRAVHWEAGDQTGGGTVSVVFAAACVRRDVSTPTEAPPSRRASAWGHMKPLTLRLHGVARAADANGGTSEQAEDLGDAIGALSDGEVRYAGQAWRTLPLPCHVSAPVTLSLRFRAGQEWVWQGQGLTVQPEADSRFFESYAC